MSARGIVLEPEQEQLFIELVDASRSVPRADREPFMFIPTLGANHLRGNGVSLDVLREDLDALRAEHLIRVQQRHRKGSGFNFTIPPRAIAFYEELRSRTDDQVEQVEAEIRRLLESPGFRQRHPQSSARWEEAVELLWKADSDGAFTTIGHKCREAVQHFVTELLEQLGITDANPDTTKTRDRFSAVINALRPRLGETRSDLLDSLFDYWKAAGDLIQRQEHAGLRESEPLTWEDGRCVVFQSAVLMFEVDRIV